MFFLLDPALHLWPGYYPLWWSAAVAPVHTVAVAAGGGNQIRRPFCQILFEKIFLGVSATGLGGGPWSCLRARPDGITR